MTEKPTQPKTQRALICHEWLLIPARASRQNIACAKEIPV